jgi:hypothetical protein
MGSSEGEGSTSADELDGDDRLPVEEELRQVLGEALAKCGYAAALLRRDEELKPELSEGFLGVVVLGVLTAPPLIAAVQLAGLAIPFAVIGWMLFFFVFAMGVGIWEGVLFIGLVLWPIGLIVELVLYGGSAAAIAFGAPLLLGCMIASLPPAFRLFRALDPWGLLRSSPLLFPVVVLLLFFPLLSADVWKATAQVSWSQLLGLSAVILLPVLIFLYRRLAGSLRAICCREAEIIATAPDTEPTIRAVARRLGKERAGWLRLSAGNLVATGLDSAEFGPYLATALHSALRRHLALTLGFVLIGGAVVLFAYIYALAFLVVQTHVAASWSEQAIPHATIHALGVDLAFPTGPYIRVTALLASLALGAFLALILTEDRYSSMLAEALINRPIRVMLALALPYLALGEAAIFKARSEAPQPSPPALPTPSA